MIWPYQLFFLILEWGRSKDIWEELKWNKGHMWPSATDWGSLMGVSKSTIVIHCNKHYLLHVFMQKWLLRDIIPIKRCNILNIAMLIFTTTDIWALKDRDFVYHYGLIMKQMFHNASFLHIFIKKSVFVNVCSKMNI